MNKFVTLLGGLALVLAATTATADDLTVPSVSGQISVDSRDDFRGQRYSTDADLGLGLKVSDIGLKGLYASGDFGKVDNDFPLNSRTVVESNLRVGYEFAVDQVNLDVSANHVYNAQEYLVLRDGRWATGNYSEVSVKASYSILFAEVTQGVGPVQNNYAQVGVNVPVTDKLHVGAAVSAYHYKDSANTRYNNSEVFASYDVLKNLQVYGKYSFGGKTDQNVALSNYGTVGVSYKF